MDYSKYQIVHTNDFVMNHMDLLTGFVDIATQEGVTSPDYRVFISRSIDQMEKRYYLYIFQMCYQNRIFYPLGQGSAQLGRWRLPRKAFEGFTLPIPEIREQTQIAKFLDYETAKIDALIDKQQQLIALLKEKRQAAISHTVTKGLNPDAPMRDSGVEWLGEVPAHWAVGKCGFYLTILSGFAFPSSGFSEDASDVRLLRGINVGVSRIRWNETARWRRTRGDGLDPYLMAENDLVIGMDRPVINEGVRVSKIGREDRPCLLLQRVASLKTGKRLSSDYLMHLFSTRIFEAHFSPETTGVSVPHISPTQTADFVIPIPPLHEQEKINDEISAQAMKIDLLISRSTEAATLLQERRTALISAAVTGKIDVRDWQAPQPETQAA